MNAAAELSDDDQLLAEIGRVARRVDPPPESAYDVGRSAFAFQRIDEELALLVADSRMEATAVRSWGEDVRLLAYRCRGMTVEVQVSRAGPRFHMIGLLKRATSGNGGRIHLETSDGAAVTAMIDDDNRFEFAEVPDAMVRFRIEAAGRPAAMTAWLEM